jgi:hypothetical protein
MLKDKYPDVEFVTPSARGSIQGKIYLGFFLALCLFISYIFGNLFLFVIVAVCTLFILLARDNENGKVCKIARDGIYYGSDHLPYDSIRSFLFIDSPTVEMHDQLRFSFNNHITPHLYIPLGKDVQKEIIYAILSARLKESESSPSFIEYIYLRLFG